MVINGPVAIAGSIPLLFKNNGTNVPINPATIITTTSDTEMARAVVWSLVNQTNKNKNKQHGRKEEEKYMVKINIT